MRVHMRMCTRMRPARVRASEVTSALQQRCGRIALAMAWNRESGENSRRIPGPLPDAQAAFGGATGT